MLDDKAGGYIVKYSDRSIKTIRRIPVSNIIEVEGVHLSDVVAELVSMAPKGTEQVPELAELRNKLKIELETWLRIAGGQNHSTKPLNAVAELIARIDLMIEEARRPPEVSDEV